MAPLWQQQFVVGRGVIGNTLFFVLAAVGIIMFFVGRWQERWGTRKLVTIGALLCGLNTFLIAYADRLWLLYLWAFLNGAASSFIYIPGLTTVQRWFPERRGLVSGLVNLVFGLSAAVMAPIFGLLLARLGYQTMNLALAGAALLLGLTAAQFTELPVAQDQAAAEQTGPAPPLPALKGFSVAQALRSSSFWYLWLTWALMGSAGIAMVTLSVPFGISRGQGLAAAVMILTAFNLTSGLSRLIMGFFSDRFSRTGGMSLTFLAAGISYLLLPRLTGSMVILLPAAVIGYAFGTLFAVSAPLAVDCFGMKHFGSIFGLVFTAYGFLAGLLGPSLSGYLLEATGADFRIVFSYLGLFCLIASFLVRRVRPILP
jgi:OFA family oxalate/formate antiporter-like MFS transporter